MTHTFIGDCATTGITSIDITSDLITAYIAALPTPDHTLTLTVKVDCGTSYDITLDGDSLDVGNNKYILTPEDISQTVSFDDQILDLTLAKELNDDSSKSYEYRCLFTDCEVKCDLIDYIANNPDDCTIYALYSTLQNLNSCSECSCEAGCAIFQYLKGLLNGTSVNVNDCGCS